MLRPVGPKGPFVGLSLGDESACAWKKDGEVVCWGEWANGQLGSGEVPESLAPVPVQGVP